MDFLNCLLCDLFKHAPHISPSWYYTLSYSVRENCSSLNILAFKNDIKSPSHVLFLTLICFSKKLYKWTQVPPVDGILWGAWPPALLETTVQGELVTFTLLGVRLHFKKQVARLHKLPPTHAGLGMLTEHIGIFSAGETDSAKLSAITVSLDSSFMVGIKGTWLR